MYCPECGVETTNGLRYCKGCGASLMEQSPASQPAPRVVRTNGAAWAVALATVAITLAGLGIVFSVALDLMSPSHWGPMAQPVPDSHIPVALVMIAFGTSTIFGIVFLLIKLFTKLMHLPVESPREARPTPVLNPPYRSHQIQAPPMQMPSVTEHTTRNFDPILKGDRRARE